MDIDTVEIAPLRAAVVTGDLAHAHETWERFFEIADAHGILALPDIEIGSVFESSALNAESEPDLKTPYYAAVFLPDGAEIPEGLAEEHLEGGRFAHTTHIGSYDVLADVWGDFGGEGVAQAGHRVDGRFCFEMYRSGPDVPEAEQRTDLYIPIG